MTTSQTAPWVPTSTLASRLVLLRHHLHLSQRAAAEQCGVPFGVWQGMEAGRGTRSVDEHVKRIAAAVNVDREWLMWGTRRDPDGGDTMAASWTPLDGVSVPLRRADDLVCAGQAA